MQYLAQCSTKSLNICPKKAREGHKNKTLSVLERKRGAGVSYSLTVTLQGYSNHVAALEVNFSCCSDKK